MPYANVVHVLSAQLTAQLLTAPSLAPSVLAVSPAFAVAAPAHAGTSQAIASTLSGLSSAASSPLLPCTFLRDAAFVGCFGRTPRSIDSGAPALPVMTPPAINSKTRASTQLSAVPSSEQPSEQPSEKNPTARLAPLSKDDVLACEILSNRTRAIDSLIEQLSQLSDTAYSWYMLQDLGWLTEIVAQLDDAYSNVFRIDTFLGRIGGVDAVATTGRVLQSATGIAAVVCVARHGGELRRTIHLLKRIHEDLGKRIGRSDPCLDDAEQAKEVLAKIDCLAKKMEDDLDELRDGFRNLVSETFFLSAISAADIVTKIAPSLAGINTFVPFLDSAYGYHGTRNAIKNLKSNLNDIRSTGNELQLIRNTREATADEVLNRLLRIRELAVKREYDDGVMNLALNVVLIQYMATEIGLGACSLIGMMGAPAAIGAMGVLGTVGAWLGLVYVTAEGIELVTHNNHALHQQSEKFAAWLKLLGVHVGIRSIEAEKKNVADMLDEYTEMSVDIERNQAPIQMRMAELTNALRVLSPESKEYKDTLKRKNALATIAMTMDRKIISRLRELETEQGNALEQKANLESLIAQDLRHYRLNCYWSRILDECSEFHETETKGAREQDFERYLLHALAEPIHRRAVRTFLEEQGVELPNEDRLESNDEFIEIVLRYAVNDVSGDSIGSDWQLVDDIEPRDQPPDDLSTDYCFV